MAASSWCLTRIACRQSAAFATYMWRRPPGLQQCQTPKQLEESGVVLCLRTGIVSNSVRKQFLMTLQAEVSEGGNAAKSGLVSKVHQKCFHPAVANTSDLKC